MESSYLPVMVVLLLTESSNPVRLWPYAFHFTVHILCIEVYNAAVLHRLNDDAAGNTKKVVHPWFRFTDLDEDRKENVRTKKGVLQLILR